MSDAQQNNQPLFSIEKVYVKDLSLEIPNAPAAFLERDPPTVDIQLHHNSTGVDEAQGRLPDGAHGDRHREGEGQDPLPGRGRPAGIFIMRNIPPQEMEAVLAIATPNILFPYVREVISDVVRARRLPAGDPLAR
jgi:preprotein translocase subunit SecB